MSESIVKGSVVSYRAFHRTWWRMEGGKRVPGAGRRTALGRHLTEDEARRVCQQWNAEHNPGKLSRKAEYERED
jgi:hypothetical protein